MEDLKIIFKYITLVLGVFMIPYLLYISADVYKVLFKPELVRPDDSSNFFQFVAIFAIFLLILSFQILYGFFRKPNKAN